jgi:SET domain-containing protein
MLLVSASLKPSDIHGLGCFTDERIEKGQVVWVYSDWIDQRIPVAEMDSLPPATRTFLDIYGYSEMFEGQKVVVLCGDHSRHMNHSDTPNLLDEGQTSYAARDIDAGEELTCNYFAFDLDAAAKLP